MKFPAPLPVDTNGVYHGLEFDDAGTNATRIYLAAQFLESDWVQTLHDNSEYEHHSFAKDGDFFATLAGKLAAQEPCLRNVTGEALFWMYDKMIVKYGQVNAMLANRRGGGDMKETKLMKFAQELYYLDESFLQAKLKSGDRLEASERKRAEKIARLYPRPMMDSIQGHYQAQAFGGHWPPREDQVAPAPRQRQGQGQAQKAIQRQGQRQERAGGGGGEVVALRRGAAVAAEERRKVAAVVPATDAARLAAENAARTAHAAAATAYAAAAVAASGPASARAAPAAPDRAVGPIRNVGAGTRTAPIFIDDFDDGEGLVAAPLKATTSARAAARASAARPY
ncbi:hypothetical protein BG015_011305 [Linnemannia schmuckeri]|uniref:Uncharacterized protein n=1 Tax=Linnemannia schmuckeri TaxID=64567 RepID=A0A9P5V7Z4_9FUNG|nr:hypothetical protein BG015_011305 [Linnemannia schmuckeri]